MATSTLAALSNDLADLTADTTLEDCARLMEQYQVRRLPVIDENGRCCAMVAQYCPKRS